MRTHRINNFSKHTTYLNFITLNTGYLEDIKIITIFYSVLFMLFKNFVNLREQLFYFFHIITLLYKNIFSLFLFPLNNL